MILVLAEIRLQLRLLSSIEDRSKIDTSQYYDTSTAQNTGINRLTLGNRLTNRRRREAKHIPIPLPLHLRGISNRINAHAQTG